MSFTETKQIIACFHCGEHCDDSPVIAHDKSFCCEGCKLVYEIINEKGLCEYYDLSKTPGISQRIKVRSGKFDFLDSPEISEKLVHFAEGSRRHVRLYLPQMHCSSCIWLLEHLPRLHNGVVSSQVDFLRKEITVIFNKDDVSIKDLAVIITGIGYEPHLSMHDLETGKNSFVDRSRIYRIGIAGFCFGNIMLLSLPEYFSSGELTGDYNLGLVFTYLNLFLSLPVFFYCAAPFFVSAYKSLKQKFLNIDAPIALAILITFGRSVFEILTVTGAGYLDSMSGIVFFMLLGRFFQDRTYGSLTFNRDYRSYFPMGVTVIGESGGEDQIPVSKIKKGDRLRVHSQEIIPADGILFLGKANIDYSFVTGESIPSEKTIGEIIYAGGKQIGGAIELEVVREVPQSYLTQLWNNKAFKTERQSGKTSFVHRLSRYFTYILFSIAIGTAVYWQLIDPAKMWNAVTAVLIVACPCALLLSATFTNGSMLSKLQSAGLFVRSSETLENIARADTLVFDKTGTITLQGASRICYRGQELSEYERRLVFSVASQSNHPLSRIIAHELFDSKTLAAKNYNELKGKGSTASVDGITVKIGSADFVFPTTQHVTAEGSRVYISINGESKGFFEINTQYRKDLKKVMGDLSIRYALALISGDNDSGRERLKTIFGTNSPLHFSFKPEDKLRFIKTQQSKGKKVVMLGDGLNDAGALMQSDAGIAISDDINNFSPACDAILGGKSFSKLPAILTFCRKQKQVIYGSFVISILYNIVGLAIAVQAELSPVIAAILMPVSSVSIVLYTQLASTFHARKLR
jgi:Cu+-exporting ATPase